MRRTLKLFVIPASKSAGAPPEPGPDVELEAYQEHVQHHADLGDHAQGRHHRARQHKIREFRGEAADDRGPQDDACEHFTDNCRLPDASKQLAYELGERHDDQHRPEQVQKRVVGRVWR